MPTPKISANDPALRSWVSVAADSDFPIQNIPFGIFSTADRYAKPCTRIGDQVVDLSALADAGLLGELEIDLAAFKAPVLNPLLRYGKQGTRRLRERLSELLRSDRPEFRDNTEVRS